MEVENTLNVDSIINEALQASQVIVLIEASFYTYYFY
jgi:hypothetical protein